MKYLVIGDPIAHSQSPEIHQKIFDYLGLNHTYEKRHVLPADLEAFIEEVRKTPEIGGFNVTIPHKTAIMQYLDEIHANAKTIGAVNTVKIEGNKLVGYNTDADGFARSLESENIMIAGKRVKMLGYGGAGKAVACALQNHGASEVLIYDIQPQSGILPWDEFTSEACDILINATSVGMKKGETPVANLNGLSPTTAVVDVIYSPPETEFLKMARELGCQTVNGMGMLVFQAIRAEEIWNEVEVDDSLWDSW